MKRNSRLSLALHTMSHMASDPDRVRTSADIAEHAGTNPVVVRRVLGKLRKAGLLTSEKGHAGGWKLAMEPQKITLADVYLALDERFVSGTEEDTAPSLCSVETGLQKRVADVLGEIEENLVHRLRKMPITDVHPKSCTYCDS
ncbi:MAG: Rrf2 family transcriptional regulator [Pseudomonadota bacterium]